MKHKETLITVIALVAIGVTSFVAYRHEQKRDASSCPFCDRMVHYGTAYRLSVGNQILVACCPRCGMHYAAKRPGDVQEARATDLNSGELIPAESAYYVEGGDVEYCTLGEHPVQRVPQGVSVRAYDRCLPTLVAFKTRPEAEAYRKQHGGRVLDYAQAMEHVRGQ